MNNSLFYFFDEIDTASHGICFVLCTRSEAKKHKLKRIGINKKSKPLLSLFFLQVKIREIELEQYSQSCLGDFFY